MIRDLSSYILQSGAFGGSNEALIREIYTQFLKPNQKSNVFIIILSSLFPSSKAIGACYSYVTKWPVLLPVAWVHRWLRFTLKTKLYVITKTKNSFVIKDRMMKALGLSD